MGEAQLAVGDRLARRKGVWPGEKELGWCLKPWKWMTSLRDEKGEPVTVPQGTLTLKG